MSKVSQAFKDTIKAYLDARAEADELFAASYAKEGKSIDECCNYIVGEVQKRKVAGFTDEEVYGLAIHYYDEDDLGEIKEVNCNVVVNHVVELTEAEKEQARQEALANYRREEERKLREKEKAKETKAKDAKKKDDAALASSPSLFDFGEDETEE